MEVEQTAPDHCGACLSQSLSFVRELPIYVRDGHKDDTIWRCAECGSYMRATDYRDVAASGHFEVSSYTPPSEETEHFEDRVRFFDYLLSVATQKLGRPISKLNILDIGCAYGHLLDRARTQGARTTAVELVDHLRERLPTRGHIGYRTIEEIPQDSRFDVVFVIDSLYYFNDPADVLSQARALLAENGFLIVRITNRTLVFHLMQFFGRSITNAQFGDAKYNFSHRGFGSILNRAGYAITNIHLHEKGKRIRSAAKWLYYRLSFLVSVILRVKWTPGLIFVAKPRSVSTG